MANEEIKNNPVADRVRKAQGRISLNDHHLTYGESRLCESSQFVQSLLEGRGFQEAPDTTARICDSCPVASHISSVQALEKILRITVPPAILSLRRLFYCAEWIESHTRRIYLIQLPELLGYESALAMAADPHLKSILEQGLRMKEIGHKLLALLGGREIHPISPCVGGFYYTPRQRHLLQLKNDLEWGLETAMQMVSWLADLPFPDSSTECEFVALSHPSKYPMNEGRLVSSKGLDVASEEFKTYFVEELAVQSKTPCMRRVNGGSYQVGPLARINLNLDRLSPKAQQALQGSGLTFPSFNPLMSIVARSLELVHAFEEILQIIQTYHQPVPSRVAAYPQAGEGCHITEAPNGMMYHCYRLDRQGLIQEVHIVTPNVFESGWCF